MEKNNNKGNSSLLLLGIIASGLMTLKVSNHFTETDQIQKNSVVERARDAGKQSNENALTIAGSLLRYHDKIGGDKESPYEERLKGLPRLYPDPYLPHSKAKLKIISGNSQASSSDLAWKYANGKLDVKEKGFRLSKPTIISNKVEFFDLATDGDLIKSTKARTNANIPIKNKGSATTKNWGTKLAAKLNMPPPPKPECQIMVTNNPPQATPQCMTASERDEQRQIGTNAVTGAPIFETITIPAEFNTCGGRPPNLSAWNIDVARGTRVELSFVTKGVVSEAEIEDFRVTGGENFDSEAAVAPSNDKNKAPYPKAASVLSLSGTIEDPSVLSFDANGSYEYTLTVKGPSGETNDCTFAMHVGEAAGNSACNVRSDVGTDPNCGDAADSFLASTKVMMADGNTKAIEEITAGDFVWNPVLGKEILVDRVASRDVANSLLKLEFGNKNLIVTPNHPLLTTNRGYVAAIDLAIGDRLALEYGASVEVNSKVYVNVKNGKVFDLILDRSYNKEDRAFLAEGVVAPGFEKQVDIQNDIFFNKISDLSAEISIEDDAIYRPFLHSRFHGLDKDMKFTSNLPK
jgi:hypothetical protein